MISASGSQSSSGRSSNLLKNIPARGTNPFTCYKGRGRTEIQFSEASHGVLLGWASQGWGLGEALLPLNMFFCKWRIRAIEPWWFLWWWIKNLFKAWCLVGLRPILAFSRKGWFWVLYCVALTWGVQPTSLMNPSLMPTCHFVICCLYWNTYVKCRYFVLFPFFIYVCAIIWQTFLRLY